MRGVALIATIVVLIIAASLVVPASTLAFDPLSQQCGIDFGNQPTYDTGDNGCQYVGPETEGGIPEGWSATTMNGDVHYGASDENDNPTVVVKASNVILRPVDPNQLIPLVAAAHDPSIEDYPDGTQRIRK